MELLPATTNIRFPNPPFYHMMKANYLAVDGAELHLVLRASFSELHICLKEIGLGEGEQNALWQTEPVVKCVVNGILWVQ